MRCSASSPHCAKIDHPEIAAVGVGLPGFVDSVNGIVHELTNASGWDMKCPLRQILRDRTGLPTIIENDAKAMAYGEYKSGAAQNHDFALASRSAPASAGRWSSMAASIAAPSSPRVKSATRASITAARPAYITTPATSRFSWATSRSPPVPPSVTSTPAARCPWKNAPPATSPKPRTSSAIPSLAKLWESIGIELGSAFSNAIWLLNPDAIVIGGGVAQAGDILFDPIRRAIRERTLPLFHENLRIVPAALGNEAGIIGNACLALEANVTLLILLLIIILILPKKRGPRVRKARSTAGLVNEKKVENTLNARGGSRSNRNKFSEGFPGRACVFSIAVNRFLGMHGPDSFLRAFDLLI